MNRLTRMGLGTIVLILILQGLPQMKVAARGQNIALGADTSESDEGWGGGSYPGDMVDGLTAYYDTWAHGLAFTGGLQEWAGQPCGWRQATVNFGRLETFDRVLVWHHGEEHIPTTYVVEYWNGSDWLPVGVSSGEAAQGGTLFRWEEKVNSTPNTQFLRVEIRVFAPDRPGVALGTMTGFLVRPER